MPNPQALKFSDPVYGDFEIQSSVLIDLISSPSVQRLKGIAQHGVPNKYYHVEGGTRFDHSLGVMRLLRILGAGEEEQIAGLLHDVSHSAFSHVIDWVIGNSETEDWQDKNHGDFINGSEIPRILEKYGYTVDRIIDYHHFGLLEREVPDLCADRIDYALRQFPVDVAAECLKSLMAKDNEIIFDNQKAAELFAENFLILQEDLWGGFESVSRYRVLAEALKEAIKEKIIEFSDFWKDDAYIVQKLENSGNKKIEHLLNVLLNRSFEDLKRESKSSLVKFRYVDPMFLSLGKVERLSDVDNDFKNLILQARDRNAKGVYPTVIE